MHAVALQSLTHMLWYFDHVIHFIQIHKLLNNYVLVLLKLIHFKQPPIKKEELTIS